MARSAPETEFDGRDTVWVLLIERGLDAGSDLQLFWHESDAVAAARTYLSASWSEDDLATADDVREAIEAANQLVGDDEFIVLAPLPVEGHQHYEGETDQRPLCRVCGEPVERESPEDPESWIHAADANDLGDHTAER